MSAVDLMAWLSQLTGPWLAASVSAAELRRLILNKIWWSFLRLESGVIFFPLLSFPCVGISILKNSNKSRCCFPQVPSGSRKAFLREVLMCVVAGFVSCLSFEKQRSSWVQMKLFCNTIPWKLSKTLMFSLLKSPEHQKLVTPYFVPISTLQIK